MKRVSHQAVNIVLAMLISGGWNLLKGQQQNLPPEVVTYADTVLYNGKVLTADD